MKTRTVKAKVEETLSKEWKPGQVRVPDLNKLERWSEREDLFDMGEMRSGGFSGRGAADNFAHRLERKEERDATCYHWEYSERAKCEMRLKTRYVVKGKLYEREVTFTSDSDSIPEAVFLKCDDKEPGNVLEVSAERSNERLLIGAVIVGATGLILVILLLAFRFGMSFGPNFEEMSPEERQLFIMLMLELSRPRYYP